MTGADRNCIMRTGILKPGQYRYRIKKKKINRKKTAISFLFDFAAKNPQLFGL
jgi:hypothetical protein